MTTTILLIIVIVALIVALAALWRSREAFRGRSNELPLITKKSKKGKQPEKLPGIRREAAMTREVPKLIDSIFTREVTAGKRRFFFDLGHGYGQRVLKISELEQVGKDEKAYTLIVFEREIRGFHRALTDAMAKLEK